METIAASVGARGGSDTRQRILDVAVELFTEQGYDKTSLREVAERLGVTKAALYYHFPSKQDIFAALAEQLFSSVGALIGQLTAEPLDPKRWLTLADALIDVGISQRRVLIMLERNQAAIESLAGQKARWAGDHQHLRKCLSDLMSRPGLSLEARIRILASLGAIMASLVGGSHLFDDVPSERLEKEIKAAVDDLLRPVLG